MEAMLRSGGVGSGHALPGQTILPAPDVFANLEFLVNLIIRGFLEVSLHRHD